MSQFWLKSKSRSQSFYVSSFLTIDSFSFFFGGAERGGSTPSSFDMNQKQDSELMNLYCVSSDGAWSQSKKKINNPKASRPHSYFWDRESTLFGIGSFSGSTPKRADSLTEKATVSPKSTPVESTPKYTSPKHQRVSVFLRETYWPLFWI